MLDSCVAIDSYSGLVFTSAKLMPSFICSCQSSFTDACTLDIFHDYWFDATLDAALDGHSVHVATASILHGPSSTPEAADDNNATPAAFTARGCLHSRISIFLFAQDSKD